MDATIDVDERLRVEPSGLPPVRGATVKVPVRMLKCGDRHMEAHMYAALKSPENSPSGFIIAELQGLPVTDGMTRTVEVTGHLTIAGVERPISINVLGDKLPDGTLRARGTLPILMTDYGITPPRPWGGILRTSNKVLIQFEIFVDPVK
jgi:polyisoprenoid-binding protein YceI